MRSQLIALIACPLIGCAASTANNAAGPTVDLSPPASLTAACDDPVRLPDRAMNDREIEIMWGRDRRALRICRDRHAALAEWPAKK